MTVSREALPERRGSETVRHPPWWVYLVATTGLVAEGFYLLQRFSSGEGPNNRDWQVFSSFVKDPSNNSRCVSTSFEPGLSTFGVPAGEGAVRLENAAEVFRHFNPVLVEGLGRNYRVRVVKAVELNNCSNPQEMAQRIREASPRVLSGEEPLYFDVLTYPEIRALAENLPGRPVSAVSLVMEVPDGEGRFGYYASDLVVVLEGGLEIHPLVYIYEEGGKEKRMVVWAQAPSFEPGNPDFQRVWVWDPKTGEWQEMRVQYRALDKQ